MTIPEQPNDLNSSQFSTGQFAPHGEFVLHSDGDILCYEASGPFNLEAIRALGITRIKAYETWQSSGIFAAIVHWHTSALMSPEAFEAYRDGYAQFVRDMQPKSVVAWVALPDVEGMSIMVRKFADCFERTNTRFRLFTEMEPAYGWVLENLGELRATPTP